MNKIRNKLFFLMDKFFNNSQILKNLNQIKLINENSSCDSSQKIIKENLSSILKHASSHSEFYKSLESDDINNFPIIDKLIINKNKSDIIVGNEKNMYQSTTSGSTGTPLTVYQDRIKLNRHKADVIYFNELAGYKLGEKLFYFRVWNKKNSKSMLKSWMQNIGMVDISVMSSHKIEKLIGEIDKIEGNKSILSFASSLESVKDFYKNKPDKLSQLNLNCIITMSESLSDDARSFFNKHLKCPVVSRYSNMENGIIAQQIKNSSEYFINHASFYVEILKMNGDEPVENNEMGRIIVTDLFNYGMPVIRYDTGDIGVKGVDEKNNLYIKKIEGRKTDFIFNTSGDLLSPHTITNSMWFFSDRIRQFQFIQNDSKDYTLKLNTNVNGEFLSISDVKNILLPYLGEDANIEVEYVNEIPLLSSGKRKKVVNLMNK